MILLCRDFFSGFLQAGYNMRYYGMDLARAVFMALGVFFHAGLIYKTQGAWRVGSAEQGSPIFDYMTSFLHSFRMYAFYIIGGFFFAMVCKKKGDLGVVKDRFLRLGIPLLFVGAFLNPWMNWASTNHAYTQSILLAIWRGEWLGHLWFIGNLLIYCIVSVKLVHLVEGLALKIRKPIHSYTLIVLFAVLSLLIAVLVYFGMPANIPHNVLFFSPNKLLYYAPYFLFGIFLYESKVLYYELTNPLKVACVLCVGLAVQTVVGRFEWGRFESLINTFLSACVYMCSGLLPIALFSRLKKEVNWVRKFSDSSYTEYV